MKQNRRTLLANCVGGAAVLALPATGLAVRPEDLDLDLFDPFGPIGTNYDRIRNVVAGVHDVEPFIKHLWDQYVSTGRREYGEWTLSYVNLWWQSLPQDKSERIRVARIGRKTSDRVAADHADSAAGPMWSAIFWGYEALINGVLDFLNQVPAFFKRLEEANSRDNSYMFGTATLGMAKAYIKLPPFPMSVGSLKKGYAYLDQVRPLMERHYALWYVVYAEAEMQRVGRDAAFQALDLIDRVCPVDVASQYTFELSVYLRERFHEAVESGKYDKYLWDPLMEPIEALRTKVYKPSETCPSGG